MKPFEVPPWEKGSEIIEFPTVGGSRTNGVTAPAKKKKPKKKKKQKQQKEHQDGSKFSYRAGHGPLAPPKDSSSDDDSEDDTESGIKAMHKIRQGRIEKSRPSAQVTKGSKKQLNLSPALAQAAVEAMDTTSTPTSTAPSPANGSLAGKFQSELLGGRFRYINEQLYSMTSRKAESLFSSDASAFEAYHAGYRQQVEKWPTNPLTRIIKTVKRLPKTAIIGDFGCGEGKLAQSVPNKVYSMDLVSNRDDIIACNITETPLKDQSLDVAVYCLSLMGTNLNDFLLEANRLLKLHGNLYIAEIQSRFEDVREFVRCLSACGFDLIKKDVAVNYFYFFHFRKMRHVPKTVKLTPFSLKPCLYRKR